MAITEGYFHGNGDRVAAAMTDSETHFPYWSNKNYNMYISCIAKLFWELDNTYKN